MKKIIFLFFVSLTLLSCSGRQTRQADRCLQQIAEDVNAVGISVAVIRDNQIIYTGPAA